MDGPWKYYPKRNNNQELKDHTFHLCKMGRTSKSIETGCTLVVANNWITGSDFGGKLEVNANKYQVSF